MNTSEVKKLLGLDMLDKFILVHYGSAVMENMYKDLFQFKNAINNLKTDYKIVVADSLQNNKFKYKNHIITAPLFSNGIDLVNASEMVISKPGMGVLQDCIASRKPLLFLPGDFPERDLKIKLLNSLFEHEMPFIREITSNSLEIGIRECLRMSSLYEGTFSKVQKNGAHIIAKTIEKLSPSI
jgi:UDP-N-acetylglucosamine transferase subunit ALG13